MTRVSKLNPGVRLEAHALAVELISQLKTIYTVRKVLRTQYRLTYGQATVAVRAAVKAIAQAHGETAVPEARSMMICRLEALYRTAFAEKRLNVCVAVLGQLSDLIGVNQKSISVQHTRAEFGFGRSDQDLEHYALTGRWLGDAVVRVITTPDQGYNDPVDPLARLRTETH